MYEFINNYIENTRPGFYQVWQYFFSLNSLLDEIETLIEHMNYELRIEYLLYNPALPGGVMLGGFDKISDIYSQWYNEILRNPLPRSKTKVYLQHYDEDGEGGRKRNFVRVRDMDLFNMREIPVAQDDEIVSNFLTQLVPSLAKKGLKFLFLNKNKRRSNARRSWRICFLIVILTYYYSSSRTEGLFGDVIRILFEWDDKDDKALKSMTNCYNSMSDEVDLKEVVPIRAKSALVPSNYMRVIKSVPRKSLDILGAENKFYLFPFPPDYEMETLKKYFRQKTTLEKIKYFFIDEIYYQNYFQMVECFLAQYASSLPYSVCVQEAMYITDNIERAKKEAGQLKKKLASCLHPDVRFIILYVILEFWVGREKIDHANVVLVDRFTRESEHFEPHGLSYDSLGSKDMIDGQPRSEYIMSRVERHVYDIFPWVVKHHKPKEYNCELQDAGGLSGSQEFEVGYCYVWSSIYFIHRIIHPDIPRDALVRLIRTNIFMKKMTPGTNPHSVFNINPILEYERRATSWLVKAIDAYNAAEGKIITDKPVLLPRYTISAMPQSLSRSKSGSRTYYPSKRRRL